MTAVVEALRGLSPAVLVHAESGAPKASAGVLSHQGAQVVPGLGGQVTRLLSGEVRVQSLPDLTGARTFTMLAWFRGGAHSSTRRLVGRENGSTWVTLEVGRDGLPATGIASTNGGWSIRVPGGRRVDDGHWHLIGVVVTRRPGPFGLDSGGVDVRLWVDDDWSRAGYIDPGLFGRAVRLEMTTPVVVGRSAAGASPLVGEAGPVAVFTRALSASQMRGVWGVVPDQSAEFRGWGIAI
ncbi:hypothetical protein B842_03250 [Corynebacterium humireducens NBRC 106098 = DSM 45392]|uniref:LamG domain-containing protein n=1 Tax=Corynebacterium humireducens NBRC 106098 = DSM 45392 TaxID=1223515 RepID=A0A0B5D8F2_9CORY|nr:LamG-like jellyroll fold domain-containing protein [Corynebacterium humireducens]AJE32503.1 hypothetical protein B842_03250 [Corynebacterium humireducens NBRC 106098 = DSM 45392]